MLRLASPAIGLSKGLPSRRCSSRQPELLRDTTKPVGMELLRNGRCLVQVPTLEARSWTIMLGCQFASCEYWLKG